MSKSKKGKKRHSYTVYIAVGLILVLIFAGYRLLAPQDSPGQAANMGKGELVGKDLKIAKADIAETAIFYPYEEADTYMEIFAVKATDGSVRTALNTCQVCYDSGRGYYKQEGNKLICQNCGNIFGVDDVEIVKGGCNPVPILQENKTEDGETITISGEFLADNKAYFENWKR